MIRIPEEQVNEFKKMPAGGYVCKIVKAASGLNRYEEPCLLLYLDVAEGEYQNYFGDIYAKRLVRGEDRYPCVYSQPVYAARNLKRLIESVEASNEEYQTTCVEGSEWDERELEQLKVGVVFGEKEFRNSRGKQRVYLIPQEITSVETIRRGEYELPERRYE